MRWIREIIYRVLVIIYFIFFFNMSQNQYLTERHFQHITIKPRLNLPNKLLLINNENIMPKLAEDTIQIKNHRPDANKVTFGKVMLESVGALNWQ